MDDDLLQILCCPVTRQPLRLADETALAQARSRVDKPLSGGLLRQDGRILYPIANGIPILLPEEGIPL